ncbi:hypothetical protein ER45_028800 (plasmid) [Bacillus mycoides]|nr:hypothetical protein ER45_028800 [Bacillus mycoides]
MKYVNKCIITICTIIGFSYLSLFHMPMSAKAALTHETTIDDIDFEKNKDTASKYATEKVKEQASRMTSVGRQAIKDFNEKDGKNINAYLTANKGKLLDKDPTNEKIKTLDTVIANQKIDKDIRVYTTQSGSSPSKDQLSRYVGKMIEVSHYGTPSLTKVSGDAPLWIIDVPKGTHAVYTNQKGSAGSSLSVEWDSKSKI